MPSRNKACPVISRQCYSGGKDGFHGSYHEYICSGSSGGVGGEPANTGALTSVLWRLLLVVFLALSFSVFLLKCGCFLSFIACWLSLCIRDIVFRVHYHMSQWVPSGWISRLEHLHNAAGHVQKWNSASLGDSLCFSECVIQYTHITALGSCEILFFLASASELLRGLWCLSIQEM